MKNFWRTRVQDLTIGQSVIYVLLVSVISLIFMVIGLMMPQCCEELADWASEKIKEARVRMAKKNQPFEEKIFE